MSQKRASNASKRSSAESVKRSKSVAPEPEPEILKDVVKVVLGRTGEGDHEHEEDYWEPQTPGKLEDQKKLIKRRLRRAEQGQLDI